MSEASILYNTVIKNGYCIGCGCCSYIAKSHFKMKLNRFGNLEPIVIENLDKCDAKVLSICPFSDQAINEDSISDQIFSNVKNHHGEVGKYLKCFAGYVNQGEFRFLGSSGGIGKWIGYKLLEEKLIDYYIHVIPNLVKKETDPLFKYTVISKPSHIIKGSKSTYYPVSLNAVLEIIRTIEGRYAITGIPCFIKAIRLLSFEDPIIKMRIKFTIGIICGGMKSANHSKMIGWDLGIKPENLIGIDFRKKYKNRPASQKMYQAWSKIDGIERYKNSNEIFGTSWNGYFTPKACSYCDDVVAETADISIGDAWLPEFIKDSKGTTILVVRNRQVLNLLEVSNKKGEISLNPITAEKVAESQAGGFRQRREGLSLRLAKQAKLNAWYPKKRISKNEFHIKRRRRRLYTQREKIAEESHQIFYEALSSNDLNIFLRKMKPLQAKYVRLNNSLFFLPVLLLMKTRRKILTLINYRR